MSARPTYLLRFRDQEQAEQFQFLADSLHMSVNEWILRRCERKPNKPAPARKKRGDPPRRSPKRSSTQ